MFILLECSRSILSQTILINFDNQFQIISKFKFCMQQYTQVAAYKRLLQVAENILYSLNPDQQILRKYQSLKKAIFNKINYSKISHMQDSQLTSNNQVDQSIFQSKDVDYRNKNDTNTVSYHFLKQLLNSYRNLIEKIFQVLASFQAQIQIQTQPDADQSLSRLGQTASEDFAQQIKEVSTQLYNTIQSLKKRQVNKTKMTQPHKQYLHHLQLSQVSSFGSMCENFTTKMQNMHLMVEVHRKMHEIIIRASRNQKDRVDQQQKIRQNLQQCESTKRQLQRELQKVSQADNFIQQHKITEESLNRYKVASRKLMKILYE